MIRKRSLISAGLASPAVGMRAKNSCELWIVIVIVMMVMVIM
jgi:hypothetical protein